VALEVAKGTLSIAAGATGAHSVTGLAFQPKAVIFFGAHTNTTGSYVADHDLMLGCATSSTQEWVIQYSSNNQAANTVGSRGRSTSACIRGQINGASATIDFEADFTSMNSDGFTVNVSNGPTNALTIHYLALGGTDITNAKAGSFTIPTSGTPFSITDPGFQPDMALFAHSYADAANPKFTIGAATGSSNAFTTHISENSGSATVQAAATQRPNVLTFALTNSVSINADIGFSAFTATGFDLTGVDFPVAAETGFYLAIEGGQWVCGRDTEGTAAAAKDTSLSFTPTGLLLFGSNRANNETFTAAADTTLSIGASDGTNEGTVWGGNDDGNTDSPAFKRNDVARAFWHATASTTVAGPPTTNNEADCAFATNKFTLTWTQAGASREFVYVAGGSSAGGPIEVDIVAATSTETAQALTVTKPIVKTLTAATSTETAQALSVAGPIVKTLTPATSNEAAQALSVTKTIVKALAPAAETDAAQALVFVKPIVKTLTPATETDAAQALDVTGPTVINLTPATSTETAQPLTVTKPILKALTPATSSEAAQAVTYTQASSYTLTPATETGLAVALTVTKTIFKTLTPTLETDVALTLTPPPTIVPAELTIIDGAQSEVITQTLAGAVVSVLDATGIMVTLSDTATVDVTAETLTGATVTITDQEH
jgi:hypothetical protein